MERQKYLEPHFSNSFSDLTRFLVTTLVSYVSSVLFQPLENQARCRSYLYVWIQLSVSERSSIQWERAQWFWKRWGIKPILAGCIAGSGYS